MCKRERGRVASPGGVNGTALGHSGSQPMPEVPQESVSRKRVGTKEGKACRGATYF